MSEISAIKKVIKKIPSTKTIVKSVITSSTPLTKINKVNSSLVAPKLESQESKPMKIPKINYERVIENYKTIKFIDFTNSEIDGLTYDFKVGNQEIQEKVCSTTTKKEYDVCHIFKNNGFDKNKRRERTPYAEGDNDYYWFNYQNKKTFYVVPEKELIKAGYIATKTCAGKKNFNLTTNYGVLNQYEFDYNTVNEKKNKDRLLYLLKLTNK